MFFQPFVRKDLIYEGITTITGFSVFWTPLSQKGPDLRRDYDKINFSIQLASPVRKDLIYEGITTKRIKLFYTFFRQKGPDLRRDYDVYRFCSF